MLRAIPFVPFRVRTSDGKYLDVTQPEMALRSRIMLFVGEGVSDPTEDIPDRVNSVSMLHVFRLEPMAATA